MLWKAKPSMIARVRAKAPWLIWCGLSVVACSVLGYGIVTEKTPIKRVFLPGRTTHGHYQIELDCHACHTTSWQMKQDACIDCHADELKQARDTHPASKFNDPANADRLSIIDAQNCLTCHKEHVPERTHPMGLSLPEDYCYHCHTDIGEKRPSHDNFAFDSCATSGCHNYHDNSALYENFLFKHAGEPDVLPDPRVVLRERRDLSADTARVRRALTKLQHDGPPSVDSQQQLIADWAETAHAAAGVNCQGCHQTELDDGAEKNDWNDAVSRLVCETCHKQEVSGWLTGLHGMRQSRELPPMTPGEARLPMKHAARHEQLDCSSCHSGHRFDTQFAAVDACLRCHDDEHSKAYQKSDHFQLWQAEKSGTGAEGSGVSCATCHMPREHDDDLDRVVVNHNQNANLQPNEKMIRGVCMNCHGLEFSLDSLADRELIENNFNERPRLHIESVKMAKRWFEQKEKEKAERLRRRKAAKNE